MISCAKCGQPAGHLIIFCIYCGNRIRLPEEINQQEKKEMEEIFKEFVAAAARCRPKEVEECDEAYHLVRSAAPPDYKYCPNCGAKLQ